MNNNFAIFILSHNRADNIKTYDTLRKCGYTGKIYVLIDNEDLQTEIYKSRFGDDLIVFDKKKQSVNSDSCDNFGNLSTPLYARNYCFEIAKKLNLSHFIMADDDIYDLKHVFVNSDDKFIKNHIKNLDSIIESLIRFINTSKYISSCSFVFDSEYFGGKNGKFKEGLGRTIQQFILFKSDTDVRFLSSKNEDLNISIANFDKLFFENFSLSVCSPIRGTNEGGILYTSTYENNMYTLMIAPSCFKILGNGKMRKNNDRIYPKIISWRFKK